MGEKDYLGKDQRRTKDDVKKDEPPIKGLYFIILFIENLKIKLKLLF